MKAPCRAAFTRVHATVQRRNGCCLTKQVSNAIWRLPFEVPKIDVISRSAIWPSFQFLTVLGSEASRRLA